MWFHGSVLFFVLVGSSESAEMNIYVEFGEDVILPCEETNIEPGTVLKWAKTNLMWTRNMFTYRSNSVDLKDQHESFKNRVFLKDSQMKDGDLSVVLKNVTIEDSGRYECVIITNDPSSFVFLISIIDLLVSPPPPGDKDGVKEEEKGSSQGVLLGMVLSGLLLAVLVLAVGLWISENQKGSNQSSRGSNQQQNPDRDLLNSERNTTNTEPAV